MTGTRVLRRPLPTEITYKGLRFLIIDTPEDSNIELFVRECRKYGAKDVVRVCEARYEAEKLETYGIKVHDWEFNDGSPPPQEIVEKWFDLLKDRFSEDPTSCVAVHCLAGLGRAPALVAIALIELGMKYEDAVDLIRSHRHGALNVKQLNYLSKYHPGKRLKIKKGSAAVTSQDGRNGGSNVSNSQKCILL